MKNNKGITLVSLVIYIAVVIVVTATVIRVTTYFKNNMKDVANVNFETEFQKINLYLLEESKIIGNGIEEITSGTKIVFTNGNSYQYNSSDKIIYLNDTIKVCENVEACVFGQKTAENGKSIISLEITISGVEKNAEYVMSEERTHTDEVNIENYLMGGSLAAYFLKAGDYVDYEPDIGTYKVAAGSNGSGCDYIQSFTTETGENALKWRVLSIDEQTGKVELISATAAQISTPLYLKGFNGYNHAVDIINDLCKNLYSNKNGATARSLTVEDINAKTTYNYTTYKNSSTGLTYGDTKQLSVFGSNYMNYPNLYSREIGYGTANVFNTEGLKESEGLEDGITDTNGVTTYSTVTGRTNGNTAGTDPYITYTYYNYKPEKHIKDLGINKLQVGLLNTGEEFWLASRCVDAINRASFGMRQVNSDGSIGIDYLLNSNNTSNETNYAVRPVISLPVELFDFSLGDGSKEKPWGLK